MKSKLKIIVLVLISIFICSGCSDVKTSDISDSHGVVDIEGDKEKVIKSKTESKNTFTNKYGTPSTECIAENCSNYIASSGDTNCCTTHSNKCLNCDIYIDGDATFCMSCLTPNDKKNSIKSKTESKNTFTNKYGTPSTECIIGNCSNYIASSGDTNCCTMHSNKCLNCDIYIDGDATFCMSCLTGN